MAGRLEALGVREASTESGVHYAHNLETGETTVAAPDVVLTKTRTMLTIKLPLPGASQDEKLEDLNNFTQEQRGAVLGRSQSWVSQRLKDETQD